MTDLPLRISSNLEKDGNLPLKPLPLWQAVWYFFIPSLVINVALYGLFPWLQNHHYPDYLGFLIGLVLPLALLLVAAWVGYHWEGRSLTWEQWKQRFRLYPLNRQTWFWTMGLVLFTIVCDFALAFTSRWLAQIPWFAPPDFIRSIVDPSIETTIPDIFLGFSLSGNWWVLIIQCMVLVVNIVGEELWWRGYILPRQELVHHHSTWIVHGLLWTLFHCFWRWNLIRLLPTCLAYAYVAQRLRNTTPTIAAHAMANALGIVPTILGILS